ncbi:DeoR family transcriptional regulator [Sinomonas atrocyanea]|uniref:DeoR family transcriptional regulator n=1 Tax=Sinomonas atrocyanea TaxID=37927 RepID=A0A126ZW48_9MICC|nr:DeoR/GlpR family DNA-binding transcription regulator [Sinomonas atrocyanea]AMM30771.1 DeoR family transcriptional regulator [Sinomonas atrocyanea]GEB63817.1 DeoR family transcriptional regulator [Sinomonas atrocyanea]GGG65101.1 DeoR family transcriptional regulator [Sinomonas atrocyanea]
MTTAQARREEIYRLATTAGLTSVEELSQRFNVTASTIRRDLALLNDQGKLARTYGGALAIGAHPEASLRQRIGEAFEEKQAIAQWAAGQVQAGESILLDGGSTVGALAHALRDRSGLTVTTPALNTVQELADSPGIHVDCLGGRLRSVSQTFVGPLAEAALERMTFDRVFLGADAVTADDGICEADQAQTRLKELMARRGADVYVLADSSKLGQRPFHAWVRLPLPWTLVTDADADPHEVELFRRAGVRVTIAQGAHAGTSGRLDAEEAS